MPKRLIVIGAGPMGLEAALEGTARGYEVTVLEKDRVGATLLRWGGTRFFSPLGMNLSGRAHQALGPVCPPLDALLTGAQMVTSVLEPLAARPPLAGRVQTQRRVVAVGRDRMTRRDRPDHPLRAERPFRLLVEAPDGEEVHHADVVLDASGACHQPAALGVGGVPAPGERALNGRLIRQLGLLESRLADLAGRDLLLVGHGHSAANALLLLETLSRAPRVTWATRSANRRPVLEIAADPLAERARVASQANDLAARPSALLAVERRASVEALGVEEGRVGVSLTGGRRGRFDAVLGFTGYRPDLSFLSELALEISPVSEGAARLTRALSNVTDCLSVPAVSPDDLKSGEPGFHLVGSKSYGRLPTFLLKNGLAQIRATFELLESRA
jgi:thioredoxin reductase